MGPRKQPKPSFDAKSFLSKVAGGRTNLEYHSKDKIFVQGEPADAVFYIDKGKVKRTVLSKQGKEAIIAILGEGDFFGEGCLAGQPFRLSTAVAMSNCSVMKVEKAELVRVLRAEPSFSEFFVLHLLFRNIKIKKIWSTICSTPARKGWRVCF